MPNHAYWAATAETPLAISLVDRGSVRVRVGVVSEWS